MQLLVLTYMHKKTHMLLIYNDLIKHKKPKKLQDYNRSIRVFGELTVVKVLKLYFTKPIGDASGYFRSNLSAFITFTQAFTKSLTNFSLLSSWA